MGQWVDTTMSSNQVRFLVNGNKFWDENGYHPQAESCVYCGTNDRTYYTAITNYISLLFTMLIASTCLKLIS